MTSKVVFGIKKGSDPKAILKTIREAEARLKKK